MKSILSLLSIIALGFGLLGCTGSGGGSGEDGPAAFAVSTSAADYGVVGNAYTSTLATTGGTAPFAWAVHISSVLPIGLLLDGNTGVVSGTPTTVGNFDVTFTVIDITGQTAIGSVLFAIHPRTDLLSVNNSVPPVPGSSASSEPSISGDGRIVAFASLARNLSSGGVGSQIYVHDWQTNQTTLISRNGATTLPTGGNGGSTAPSISSDGRFVAFISNATDLLPAGSSAVTGQQIYVHDRQLGVTSLVSRNNSGIPATAGSFNVSPSINGNGRFIAFVSNATNLGATGTQVYLHDTQAGGQIILISKNNNLIPDQGNGDSGTPSISTDGCFVAFASASTNLGDPVANQIYVRGPLAIAGCAGAEQTSLVSKSTGGTTSNGLINRFPAASGNGRFIAFTSDATNLGASGTQVYLRDIQGGGQTILISKDNTNPTPLAGNSLSDTSSISSDGCFVAFASTSTNLGAPAHQIHVRGPLAIAGCVGTEQTSLVSKDSSGNPANGALGSTVDPTVSGNGQFIAFSSLSTNLISPPPGNRQIYVRALP